MFSRSHVSAPVERLTSPQNAALLSLKKKLADGTYPMEPAACLCGATTGELIATTDRYALPVNTWLCRQCGMLWTSPRLTRTSLELFYQNDYRPIYVGSEAATEDFFQSQIRDGRVTFSFVSDFFPRGGTVFDVGCGAGGTLIPFLEAGWRTFGCDTGAAYLERGRQAGLILEQGDLDSLRRHGGADLIIFRHALEHLPDPAATMQQAVSMLNTGGCIYVELPGVFGIHRTYGGDLMMFLQNAHLYHFTLRTLSAFMARFDCGMIKGHEGIQALFRHGAPIHTDVLDYRRVLRYLTWIEIGRRTGLHRLRAWLQ